MSVEAISVPFPRLTLRVKVPAMLSLRMAVGLRLVALGALIARCRLDVEADGGTRI